MQTYPVVLHTSPAWLPEIVPAHVRVSAYEPPNGPGEGASKMTRLSLFCEVAANDLCRQTPDTTRPALGG